VAWVYKQLFSAIGFDELYIIVSELEFPLEEAVIDWVLCAVDECLCH
jgi:hypothetical protein